MSLKVTKGFALSILLGLLFWSGPIVAEQSCNQLIASLIQYNTTAVKNARLDDAARVKAASNLLERELAESEAEGLLKAHEVGRGQIGRDGKRLAVVLPDGSSNYTFAHIKEKRRLLLNAGFSDLEIRRLLKQGLAGDESYDGLADDVIEALKKQKEEFQSVGLAKFSPYTKELPAWKGDDEMPFKDFWKGIYDFLNKPEQVFERIHDFEILVLKKMKESNLESKAAMEEVMAAFEKKEGFKKAIDINTAYSSQKWWEMLSAGAHFNDLTFSNGNHGSFTHRIQWHLLMKEFRANPGAFGYQNADDIPKLVEVYKMMGNKEFIENTVGWDSPSGKDFWFMLFDDTGSKSAHHPEFMTPTFKAYTKTGLGGWN